LLNETGKERNSTNANYAWLTAMTCPSKPYLKYFVKAAQ